MAQLLVIIVCWNRPDFLRQTLSSIFRQFEALTPDVVAIDNGSDEDTRQILLKEDRLHARHFQYANQGINAAIDLALDRYVYRTHRWILVSDADMEYRLSPIEAIEFLESSPEIGAVSFQYSPEHFTFDYRTFRGRIWPLKRSERGCALLFRVVTLLEMRPLPVHKMTDFDWWVCRDAPASLQSRNQAVAVFVGGARHLGWRQGDSTWQAVEIPECAEFRL